MGGRWSWQNRLALRVPAVHDGARPARLAWCSHLGGAGGPVDGAVLTAGFGRNSERQVRRTISRTSRWAGVCRRGGRVIVSSCKETRSRRVRPEKKKECDRRRASSPRSARQLRLWDVRRCVASAAEGGTGPECTARPLVHAKVRNSD